jgi:hypothetical protein
MARCAEPRNYLLLGNFEIIEVASVAAQLGAVLGQMHEERPEPTRNAGDYSSAVFLYFFLQRLKNFSYCAR